MATIEDIEGIGPEYGAKLNKAGVETVEALLKAGATASGRAQLAEETGISEKLILEWVNHADLYRINGVGSEYADLLEAAGVDTVVELAQRNPENLHLTLIKTNEAKNLVRKLPDAVRVEQWIKEAKTLPKVVSH